ncbi:MAG: hypothetical protein LBD89_06815 [Tannerellaceae bacterium]|nr:hypothetical protein [Tannerellaceae bacterium]
MKRYVLCSLCLTTIFSAARAQEKEINNYLLHAGARAVLYAGKEETTYAHIHQHPYLDTEHYREGTLYFAKRTYPQQPMRVNVYTDELVVLAPEFHAGIALPSERVDSVVFSSYTLIYNDGKETALPSPGYYARLYNGKYSVWKRQTKLIERMTNGMNIEQTFTTRTRFYIHKDGQYHSVGSKNSLLKLFAGKKKELKLFFRRQQLNFRQEAHEAIVRTVMYYESLNP